MYVGRIAHGSLLSGTFMSFDIILWLGFGVFLAVYLYSLNKNLFVLALVLAIIIGVVAMAAYNIGTHEIY